MELGGRRLKEFEIRRFLCNWLDVEFVASLVVDMCSFSDDDERSDEKEEIVTRSSHWPVRAQGNSINEAGRDGSDPTRELRLEPV